MDGEKSAFWHCSIGKEPKKSCILLSSFFIEKVISIDE